jgi:hypothetical protein
MKSCASKGRGRSVIRDSAPVPWPTRTVWVCSSSFAFSFTSAKGRSGSTQESECPEAPTTCSARNVPAGTVTDSQPTTLALRQFSKPDLGEPGPCPPCGISIAGTSSIFTMVTAGRPIPGPKPGTSILLIMSRGPLASSPRPAPNPRITISSQM